ncbi:MAG: tetratricopeptide repeat protein [Chitinophagales bacterium]|nr:tetratricopeptide repeat protein [Chitinophagales bacterium]MDW8419136.1 tetratricopeptide repeat protein [Chitinophagales bacterium]
MISVRWLIVPVVVLHMALLQAQETQWYLHAEEELRNGIALFEENNFAAARQKLEEIYKIFPSYISSSDEVLRQQVDYYIAVSAAECGDQDAVILLQRYLETYHETDRRRMIYLYLGKWYYRNAQYSEATPWLEKVNVTDLNNRQVYEHRFMLGYCYFVKKKFEEARPLFSTVKDIPEKYYYPANYYYAFICFYQKDYAEALRSFSKIEDSKMYAPVIPYYVAQIHYAKKDLDKTIAYVRQSLTKPGVLYRDELNYLLGQAYFQKDDYSAALPLLEAYMQKNTKVQKEDIYRLAYCQYRTGAFKEAVENFKQLNLLNDPMGQNATYALADCYLKLGQKDKARSAFQSASTAYHDQAIREESLFQYARLSFETGFVNDAITALEDYLAVYPNGKYADEVNETLAAALVHSKNYDRAWKLLEKMKLSSPMLKEAYQQVTYFRAIELFNDAQYAEALKLCEKSLSSGILPDLKALATYLKGEILYQQEKYPAAAEEYRKYTTLSTPEVERKGVSSKFRAWYNIGYCAFKQKDYSNALLYFGKALQELAVTADNAGKKALLPDLYLRYADCGFVTRNYTRALEGYSAIVTNNWASAPYAQFQISILYGLQGKNDAKIEALDYLIQKYGNSAYADQAYFEKGETYMNESRYAPAREAYQTLIAKYPNSKLLAKSHLKIAVIDYNNGKKEQSIEDYKTVVRKFPNTPEANEAMGAMREIYLELGRAQEYVDFTRTVHNYSLSEQEQDSLLYENALKIYEQNDCPKAISLFSEYLKRFPGGIFAYEAHWRISDCHIKLKSFNDALAHLESVINHRYGRYYERALQRAAGICYYDLKLYEKSLQYYKLWYPVASTPANTYASMTGMLQAAHQLGRYDEVIEYADLLLNSGMAKEPDIQDAHYKKGFAWYSKQERDLALQAFRRVSEFPVNAKCVESKYMVAKILHEQGQYRASLDTCFKLKNKYASYEYWVVKTFILMADNYYAMDNAFQAKATLESIVQNYDGDEQLLNEARQKLEKIRSEELQKSKLMLSAPPDTLMFENDTILLNK